MFVQEWLTGIGEALVQLRALVPSLLGALAVIGVGWLLAGLLRALSRRLTAGVVNRLGRHPAVGDTVEAAELQSTVPSVVGSFVFWSVFLIAIAGGMEIVGLPIVTGTVSRFASYLPNVLAAVLILLTGVFAGNLARSAATRAATTAGVAYPTAIGRTLQVAIQLVALVVAIEEIGIEGQLLVVLISIAFGAVLAGAGLAFGLGARTTVANIIASHYLAQTVHAGQTVQIGDVRGRVLSTTAMAVVIDSAHGRVHIPAKKFSEEISVLVSETA